MGMIGKKKKARIEFAVIGILLVCLVLLGFLSSGKSPSTPAEMLQAGEACYADGDWTEAIQYLRLCCQAEPDNADAYILLGDCYLELGQQQRADEVYRQAAQLQIAAANELNENRRMMELEPDVSQITLRIEPAIRYTRNMTLSVSGNAGNLVPEVRVNGRINQAKERLIEDAYCRTTAWFPVHSEMKHLLLTGNFNCAVWQFKDADGNIRLVENGLDYMLPDIVTFSSPSYDTVAIPEDAVSARVMYWDANLENTAFDNDEIFIGYGRLPVGYTDTDTYTAVIPDLHDGQYILYEQGEWKLWDGTSWETLDWDALTVSAGACISIDGELCGKVTIVFFQNSEKKQNAEYKQEYGIRFNPASGLAVGERLGAAQGMRFNCVIAGEYLQTGVNDFDKAYPWSAIRRCNIASSADGNSTIIYEGEPGFSLDGSTGNVMVEIPKFYVKRESSDGFEEIWISGYAHEGYQLEPVFIGADGQELDYVYMSAYMGAEKDECIVSAAGVYPTLMLTYGDTLRMAQNNGNGFSEVSFMMYSALQKLFMVEVGTLDASSVFAGDTMQCYFYHVEDITRSCLAAEDAIGSNVIVLYDNYNTDKLVPGASVALLADWEMYENNNAIQRKIVSIERRDGRAYVTFDGAPVDILGGKTAVSGIPALTGETNALDYHTGTDYANDGKHSFKYRHIENLYGSALVMLNDDAYMDDGAFWYETADGSVSRLDALIAEQHTDLSNYRHVNQDCCVRAMTYDAEHPTVMLPAEVGGGASVHTGYGDYWMWRNPEGRRYFLYGGAGDNGKVAGIFQYRAIISSDKTAHSFYSARIMYCEG